MLEQRFNKPKPGPYTQRSRNSRPLALACSLHVSAGLVWRNLEEPSGEDFNVTLSKQVTRPLSILDPLTCGYAKVILYEASKEKFSSKKDLREGSARYTARVLAEISKDYHNVFLADADSFKMEFHKLTKCIQQLRKTFQEWSRKNGQEKIDYTSNFNRIKWQKLSRAKRELHALIDWKAC